MPCSTKANQPREAIHELMTRPFATEVKPLLKVVGHFELSRRVPHVPPESGSPARLGSLG